MEEKTLDIKKKESKIAKISIDTKVDDLLTYNKEGKDLVFESEPGKFLTLEDEIISQLSPHNKTSYWASFGLNRKEIEQRKNPRTMGLKVQPRFATAATRMEVINPDPRFHYCWKRPDELQIAKAEGFEIEKDLNVQSFQTSVGGSTHCVGVAGDEELVLMKIPNELYDARLKAAEDLSKRRNGAVEESAMAALERQGGKPFKPNERDNNNWS